jgi:hypothetical protein
MQRLTLSLMVLAAWSVPAQADLGFSWKAPAACPVAEDVGVRIERRLGASSDPAQRESIDAALAGIEIAVVRDHGEYVAHVDARAVTVANAVRTLRSRRCEALADAVAVVLARLVSELREHPSISAPPAADPVIAVVDDEPAPFERRVVHMLPPPEKPAPRAWGAGMRLVGTSGIGVLPGVSIGGELGGYVRYGDYFGEAAYVRWQPQGGMSGAMGLQVTTMRAGWRPEALPLRAWGAVELGSMSGTRTESDSWAAVGAGFGVAWQMSPYARLVGAVELMVPVGTNGIALDGGPEVWQASPATARSSLGIEVGLR